MSKYICSICGYAYDEADNPPFDSLPDDWKCPLCGAPKSMFKKDEPEVSANQEPKKTDEPKKSSEKDEELRPLSNGELAAICSSLSRACEKQYKPADAALFTELAEYYISRVQPEAGGMAKLREKLDGNLADEYPAANRAAEEASDRGAKRILVWSEKVSRIIANILDRYEKEGSAMLENTKIWVCDVCGFIYIGDNPPAVCPVCKVPAFKILEVV